MNGRRARQPAQTSLTLRDLLTLMESGAVALPDFQRPYVWDEGKVRSLLATVINGWPAGLILLMEAPPDDFFAMRSLEGGPKVSAAAVRHLVLDGQQRLTALLEGFGTPDLPSDGRTWYLDLVKYQRGYVAGDGELEECIVSVPHGRSQLGSRDSRRLMPLRALRSPEEFLEWRDHQVERTLLETDVEETYLALNGIWAQMSDVADYRLPTVVLDRSMPLSTVAHVFERLNTSGLQLSTFDLVVAHVYRDGFNLRDRWDDDLRQFPAIRPFAEEDPQLAIEIIALIRAGDTRRESLLRLSAETVWTDWPDALRALEEAAAFLSERCGIVSADQLPSRAVYLVLAALAWQSGFLQSSVDSLRYWVYSSALTGTFSVGVNTRVVSEYRDLIVNLPSRPPHRARIARNALVGATRRAGASVWSGIEALIRQRDPIDLPVGLFEFPMPGERLKPTCVLGPSPRGRNADPALGMVLVTGAAAREVEYRGASHLGSMLRGLPEEYAIRFCDEQLLPHVTSPAYRSDRDFLNARADLVRAEMDRLYEVAANIRSQGVPETAAAPEGSGSFGRALVDNAELEVRTRRDVVESMTRSFGPHNAATLRALYDLGTAELRAGLHMSALDTLRLCEEELSVQVGPLHPELLATIKAIAVALGQLGRNVEALEYFASYARRVEELFGVASVQGARANASLAVALARVGRLEEATEQFARALEAIDAESAATVRRHPSVFVSEISRAIESSDPIPAFLTLAATIAGEGSPLIDVFDENGLFGLSHLDGGDVE